MSETKQDFDLSGRVAVVTGASSGIGEAIAEALARAGAKVVAVGRNHDRLTLVTNKIQSFGGEALAVDAELTDAGHRQQIVDRSVAEYGKIDVLALAAGVFLPATFEDTSTEDLNYQIEVNAVSPIALARAALPHMGAGSSIIFVTSTTARFGFANTGAYAASKGALDSMMRVMAIELAPKQICVNAVSPGWTATPMNEELREDKAVVAAAIAATPAGRLAIPEDIAPSVIFLASDAARYVQGLILTVEGGYPSLPDVIRSSGNDETMP